MELTPRQADVLLMIRNHRHLHGHSPSIREIASTLQIGRATTMAHLARLEHKGLIRRTRGKHRTLEVVEDSQGVKPAPTPRDRAMPRQTQLEKIQARIDALRSTG
jgi:SOS-response transcriptional repressor LexA